MPTTRTALAARCIAALALVLFGACASTPTQRVEPVGERAASAMEEAYAWTRSSDPDAARRAVEAATRARDLEPTWVPPRRLLDELMRAELLGIDTLARHRRELEEHPDDPVLLYLTGRLEGRQAGWRFERALRADPESAWGHHGLGWVAAQEGELATAVRHAELALERARSRWERTFFTAALARYEVLAGGSKRALNVLLEAIADPETSPVGRIELSVQAAQLELSFLFQPEAEQGAERALALLREADLTDREVERLVSDLRVYGPRERVDTLELQLALAERPGAVRDRLRAELMLADRPTPLALGLLKRSREVQGLPPLSGPLMRAAYFGAGQFQRGVEVWLRDLPLAVLDDEGAPRDPALSSIVRAARNLEEASIITAAAEEHTDSEPANGFGAASAAIEGLATFGDLLVEAGWFIEARAVAATLAAHDLDRALELEERAAAGQELLRGVVRLMSRLEDTGRDGAAFLPPMTLDPVAELPSEPPGKDLDGLLAALAPNVQRFQSRWGHAAGLIEVQRELVESPTYDYGPVGALIHPGPWFSAADERAGLGPTGASVPGFAALMDRVGRFAVFGELVGQGAPDGTILKRLWVEERSGEHLGVPWSGTIAWCEGTDLRSRAARLGANIAGAALHEGYWIDIEVLRRERERWWVIQQRFGGVSGRPRMDRALSTRGLRLLSPAEKPEAQRRERRSTGTLLGEADRMRLAVLRDRIDAGIPVQVTLDDLLELTARHEEGHLCDRTRFLPLARNAVRVARFLMASGLSGSGVAQRLEYRAQLIALCQTSDPRLAWVEILAAGESEGPGVTPHNAAYQELLEDLMRLLERKVHAHLEDWPELDTEHVLVHQLHWVEPEKLRALALELAREQGLIGS